jgi:septal ring factor EnvC (AmiA/AmiB activator)
LLVAVLVAAAALPSSPVPLHAQRPQPLEQQLRDDQRRLEDIRRERSEVEMQLEQLRTQAHSLADELSNIERQRLTTNRIVNELDRQIGGLSTQIDRITMDLVLAQDALEEKRAVLDRRLVDIYKRGTLYTYQSCSSPKTLATCSHATNTSIWSAAGPVLANDMFKLGTGSRASARACSTRVMRRGARSDRGAAALSGARAETAGEPARHAPQLDRGGRRLSELERNEHALGDRIAALERARREAEARGAPAGASAITTADLGRLDWPVAGRIVYQFGTATGPNNTRIPWHGIGIGAPVGTPVRAVANGTVSLAGPLGTYLTSVLLDHGGGYYSFYGYLADATVAKGTRVLKGEVIGHVGGQTSNEGPHLHFEIRGQGGIALDPINWLKRQR